MFLCHFEVDVVDDVAVDDDDDDVDVDVDVDVDEDDDEDDDDDDDDTELVDPSPSIRLVCTSTTLLCMPTRDEASNGMIRQ